jgi:hypothetical protein
MCDTHHSARAPATLFQGARYAVAEAWEMHHTELRWIEIADERLFCTEFAAQHVNSARPSGGQNSTVSRYRLPMFCAAMVSLPLRALNALYLHCRR